MGRVSDARDRLLDAAIKLVWRNSYGAVSVDDICREAGVKKGSFYHFFPGKNELLAAGYRRLGEMMRPEYDRLFSPSLPPVERLRGLFKFILERQMCLREETGCILGCPFASIGTELIAAGASDGGMRDAIQGLIRTKVRYLESALRDAMADGSIPKGNASALAQTLYLYVEGAVAHARIQNDPEFLKGIEENGLRLIGFQPAVAV